MKHAAFFCENCGKPVPLNAKECPHCGSRFTAVQCPECSYVGEARLFASGCPRCGYLAPQFAPGAQSAQGSPAPSAGDSPAGQGEGTETREAVRSYRRSSSRLPGWFYTVASIALLVILIALGVVVIHLK